MRLVHRRLHDGVSFDLPPCYSIIETVGKGSYGIVVSARHQGYPGTFPPRVADPSISPPRPRHAPPPPFPTRIPPPSPNPTSTRNPTQFVGVVAVKKVFDALESDSEARRAYREVLALLHVQEDEHDRPHENVTEVRADPTCALDTHMERMRWYKRGNRGREGSFRARERGREGGGGDIPPLGSSPGGGGRRSVRVRVRVRGSR